MPMTRRESIAVLAAGLASAAGRIPSNRNEVGTRIESMELLSAGSVHGYSRRDAGYRVYRASADSVSPDTKDLRHHSRADAERSVKARVPDRYDLV